PLSVWPSTPVTSGCPPRVAASRPGFSTLITSAPRSARTKAQKGPASACVQSSTTSPSSGPATIPNLAHAFRLTPVKLSCLPVSLFQSVVDGQMGLDAWVRFAREIGLDGTEASLAFLQPIGRYSAGEMGRVCDEAGLAV